MAEILLKQKENISTATNVGILINFFMLFSFSREIKRGRLMRKLLIPSQAEMDEKDI